MSTNPELTPPLKVGGAIGHRHNLIVRAMIESLLPQLGGVLTQRRESLWATQTFVATAEDVVYGCTIGKNYELWVAQREGATQKGSKVAKGDWFVVEKKQAA